MSRLYLPHTSRGLQLRAISSLYKCSQISRYHPLLPSKDGKMKRLAEKKLKRFASNKSLKFNPIVSTSPQPKTILEMAKRLSRSEQENPMLDRSFLKVQPYTPTRCELLCNMEPDCIVSE